MRTDGSEVAELHELNAFDIQSLQAKLKIAKAQNQSDGYTQANDAFALLREARDLLEITALESPLRRDILELNLRIDEFYPQAKEK